MAQLNEVLIYKFLNKETSGQENEEVRNWVVQSEENKEEFRRIHRLHSACKEKKLRAEIDIDQAWTILEKSIDRTHAFEEGIDWFHLGRIAASIILILTSGLGILWIKDHLQMRPVPQMVTIESPRGEKSKVVLSDGTRVWINSQSVLKYNPLLPRKVDLEGEAYFEVTKENGLDFEVNTPVGMKVIVTGTRFDLKCYKEESFAEVTLEEGEVHLDGADSKTIATLKPGQQAKYDPKTKDTQIRNVSAEIYSLWRNDELRFSNITFRELIPRIERWYGINISLDPEISKRDRFTMTIKTESLRELLNMMQLTSKFKYEINGSQVTIRAK
jgi:transmembrane sensor